MMKNLGGLSVILLAVMLVPAVFTGADDKGRLEVVDHVDLSRYLGTWHEIASIPSWFQEKCAYGVTANYSLRADGDVAVLNSCYTENGELRQAKGRAWVVDETTNAKLKVSFLPFGLKLFGGDYWIIDLGPDYEYAVVGHPQREYGWILSRTSELPEQTLSGIISRLEQKGYDFSMFEMSRPR